MNCFTLLPLALIPTLRLISPQPRPARTVPGSISKGHLGHHRPLDVKSRRMLIRHPDPAVHLHALVGGQHKVSEQRALAKEMSVSASASPASTARAAAMTVERANSISMNSARRPVLERLKAANQRPELGPGLQVVQGIVENLGHAAEHFRA